MPAIDTLFDKLLELKGSDLHLSVGYPAMIRAKGELVPMSDKVLEGADIEKLLYELLDERQRAHYDTHHDLDFAYGFGTKARFRANYFVKATGLGAVFR